MRTKTHSLRSAFLFFTLFLAGSTTSTAQSKPVAPAGWRLVWSDEFNGKTLDLKKWNVLIRETSKHGELQYYVPDEVYLENGNLRIRSQRRDYGGMSFTSGRLSTDQRFASTYGRFEIRGRMPTGKGMWPAYWLYPQNRDWAMEQLMSKAIEEKRESSIPELRPWYSEIDIMEFLGHEPNVFYGTLHYTTFKGEKKSSSGKLTTVDLSKDFHLYALEWEPNEIRWYVDGALVHRSVLGVPHTPHYLILNTAVGGGWPGNPDSTTTFPQYHDIDYVRIYQRQK